MPVTAIILGVGSRGGNYAHYSDLKPDEFQVVGVAEPREKIRDKFCARYKLEKSHVFSDWKEVFALPKFADCVIITTPDRLHKDPAVTAAKMGYHILLEKPMAPTREDCEEIYQTCAEAGVMLAVCHVLRYMTQSIVAKQLIDSGTIGKVVNIQLIEPVGFWHFAHSYVRGNWRKESTSSMSLLAKSCHDLDLIQYWMGDAKCTKVSSFGSLVHFCKEDKPEGATEYCLDCPVEKDCAYSAKKIYLDRAKMGDWGFPVGIVSEYTRDIEDLESKLRTGSYGRCVYQSDNDVCSNQVVNMEYEGGKTVSFSMVAFTQLTCVRQVRIHGTKGQLEFDLDGHSDIKRFDFLRKRTVMHEAVSSGLHTALSGHGGADFGLMQSFVKAIKHGDRSMILTGPRETLTSHELVFAAEQARHTDTVVKLGPVGPDGIQAAISQD